jgi:hypothetical protein
MVAGPIIAFAPVVLWLVFSIGCYNAFDESTCGGAVYLWYLNISNSLGDLGELCWASDLDSESPSKRKPGYLVRPRILSI